MIVVRKYKVVNCDTLWGTEGIYIIYMYFLFL